MVLIPAQTERDLDVGKDWPYFAMDSVAIRQNLYRSTGGDSYSTLSCPYNSSIYVSLLGSIRHGSVFPLHPPQDIINYQPTNMTSQEGLNATVTPTRRRRKSPAFYPSGNMHGGQYDEAKSAGAPPGLHTRELEISPAGSALQNVVHWMVGA